MLYELIQPYTSVSTVGMCKNAGKTTVLNELIRLCAEHGETVALTSVGRDGERSDLVTGTKKPEIFVYSGTLIATAADCLDLGDVSREILWTSGMPTPMGEVVLARAWSDGLVQLAGPSMTAQLRVIREKMLELGAGRVFIDGALSRKSLAMPAVSDAAILSTGASYSRDMKKTVNDTAHSAALMSLERTEREDVPEDAEQKFTVLCGSKAQCFELAEDAADALRRAEKAAVLIRGGVTDRAAEAFFSAGRALSGTEFIAEDGSRLLLSAGNYEKLLRAGSRFTVLKTTRLLAVTVNPFSAYGTHYDTDAFLDAMRRAVPAGVPVLNVKTKDA